MPNIAPTEDLLSKIKKYTGKPTLTFSDLQIILSLEQVKDASSKELSEQIELSENAIISGCQRLNQINLCWWLSELVSPRYYLTAECKCMLNEIRKTPQSP